MYFLYDKKIFDLKIASIQSNPLNQNGPKSIHANLQGMQYCFLL
ncbi:hypothetical protein DYY66_1704 [Candidatus Nitrosotalea sp. FS]|nr:hypothetical protein [Candidatus Nitrosotalea sp. FS]